MKKLAAFIITFVSLSSGIYSQNYSDISIRLLPRVDIPVTDSYGMFKIGGSGQLSLNYKPPVKLPFYIGMDIGYGYTPLRVDENLTGKLPLQTGTAGGSIGLDIRFLERLNVNLYSGGGYYFGFTKDLTGEVIYGGNAYIDTGADFSFYFSRKFLLGLGASYRILLGSPAPFMNSIGIYLGSTFRIPISGNLSFEPKGLKPAKLKLSEISQNRIFPVFYKYYDTHPIGKAEIQNFENSTISNIEMSVFIKQYMDSPKIFSINGRLKRGEKRTIDLYALFNDNVLTITEGAIVAAEFDVSYSLNNEIKKVQIIKTIKLENRNASMWDDDRRAAAFITTHDPSVLRFSKQVAGYARKAGYGTLDLNLRTAIAIHEALGLAGINYVVDPSTPYEQYHENENSVDFLQFPRQTLEYKAGDCDDLSILYAALLESVNINTALITVPGHIYIAFALKTEPVLLKKLFNDTDNFIIRDGRVWMPFEVTEVGKDFLNAWKTGAKEWRRYAKSGKAGFFPVTEAWKVFEPVGLPGEGYVTELPSEKNIVLSYQKQLNSFIQIEIAGKVNNLKNRIALSGGSAILSNRLGVLYARYGLFGKAAAQFKDILKKRQYLPALINLGNISIIKGDLKQARLYYLRAEKRAPDSPKVILGIAKLNYQMEKYKDSKSAYEKLKIVAPDIAEKFSYLAMKGQSSKNRAVDAEKNRKAVLWEE